VGTAADGVVVGSALVRTLAEEGVDSGGRFVAVLRRALDGA
jgi:tryptophan synthase alpha subunit